MEDFLLIDSLLSSEQIMARDTVRRFVDAEVTPLMTDAYEAAKFPQHLAARMADLRLLGMTLPPEFGGVGADAITYGLVCQELERGDSALRSFIAVQNSLCMFPIFKFGTAEQKKHYLPQMAQGKLLGCFGLTESGAGSDPASMQTQAKKVEGGYVLTGSKAWITNAPIADLAIVWAKTDSDIQGFVVETNTPGFRTRETVHKLSMRASATGELFFDDCFIPDTAWLPGTAKGLSTAFQCLSEARYGIAWGATGAAMACYQIALEYTQDRQQFGKPLASYQLIQKDLVDMLTSIIKSQLLSLQLGRLKDQNLAQFQMISLAKMTNVAEALKISRQARNLLGANGISLEYHVIRHMANLETVFTYEGTDHIHHLIVGKHITGLDAFSA